MSVETPLPRSNRKAVLEAATGQTSFGPFGWPIYDALDVAVEVDGDPLAADAFTVVPEGSYPSLFSVVLDAAPGAGAEVTVAGRRTHERVTNVTQGGAIRATLIEKEFDRQTVALQELRRDVDDVTETTMLPEAVLAARDQVAAMQADVTGRQANVVALEAQTQAARAAAQTAAAIASNLAGAIKGTSATTLAIASGSKSLATQANKQFEAGAWLLLVSASDPAHRWMHGPSTAYDPDSGALTVDVRSHEGEGERSDWTIYVSGTGLNPADLAALAQAVADAQDAQAAAEAAAGDAAGDAAAGDAARTASEAARDAAQAAAIAAEGYAAILENPDYGFFSDEPSETRDYGDFA